MAHFTVLVIGENPEEQLAPFQENNMGDCPKEYLQLCAWTENGQHWFESEEEARKTLGEQFKPEEAYWENPNAKWDWYQLGGRWTGYFKLKEGVKCITGDPGLMTPIPEDGWSDQCYKDEIDIEGMRKEAADKAKAKYEIVERLFDGAIPKVEKTWDDFVNDKSYGNDYHKRRKDYHNQPALLKVKMLNEMRDQLSEDEMDFVVWGSLDDFQCTKEQYIKKAMDSCITSFAVLKDGKWYERGEMGWWACVSDENKNWDTEFSKLFDNLPGDTLLSIYDCHI